MPNIKDQLAITKKYSDITLTFDGSPTTILTQNLDDMGGEDDLDLNMSGPFQRNGKNRNKANYYQTSSVEIDTIKSLGGSKDNTQTAKEKKIIENLEKLEKGNKTGRNINKAKVQGWGTSNSGV